MFDFNSPRQSPEALAVEQLRPLLSSRRLVNLFLAIGMLAVTNGEAVKTIEMVVARFSGNRALRAAALTSARKLRKRTG
jgi:hypothetical protein